MVMFADIETQETIWYKIKEQFEEEGDLSKQYGFEQNLRELVNKYNSMSSDFEEEAKNIEQMCAVAIASDRMKGPYTHPILIRRDSYDGRSRISLISVPRESFL